MNRKGTTKLSGSGTTVRGSGPGRDRGGAGAIEIPPDFELPEDYVGIAHRFSEANAVAKTEPGRAMDLMGSIAFDLGELMKRTDDPTMRGAIRNDIKRAGELVNRYDSDRRKMGRMGFVRRHPIEEEVRRIVSRMEITMRERDVRLDDIIGHERAKEEVRRIVIDPIRDPTLFGDLEGSRRAVFLYGPPGTGKTMLAKAAATESGGSAYFVKSGDILHPRPGETEKVLEGIFSVARDEDNQPSVVIFDEANLLLHAGDTELTRSIIDTMLRELSLLQESDDKVLVVFTTNFPTQIDPAFYRRGTPIEIRMPSKEELEELFRISARKRRVSLEEVDVGMLAEKMHEKEPYGLTGNDVAQIVDRVKRKRLQDFEATDYNQIFIKQFKKGRYVEDELPDVTEDQWLDAIHRYTPTVTRASVEMIDEFKRRIGEGGGG